VTHAIRVLNDPMEFAALEPMVREYMELICNDLKTYYDIDADPLEPVASTMSAPEKYLPPQGRTFLSETGGRRVAMGFLRPLTGRDYEIKRLYVRPEAQGAGLGRAMLLQIIDNARALGGKRLFLDTITSLKPAIRMYEIEGFRHIEAYEGSDVASYEDIRRHGVYMVKDL